MLAIGAVLLHAMPACLGGGDEKLNPQPLPPADPDDRTGVPTSDDNGSTSSGGNGATPEVPGSMDAAVPADADAATDGGGDE